MILLTGATGKIGTPMLAALAASGHAVRVLARDPARVPERGPLVEVVTGDLDEPATLEPALDGVRTVFMLVAGPDVPAQEAALIAASQRAGVAHLVMLSSLGAELGGVASGPLHMPGEQLLLQSGLAWTILHPSEFMSNTLWWADSIKASGSIFVPTGAGRVGFIDPADIGAVAAAVLTSDGHEGRTYRLTGPEALSTAELAEVLGQARGEPVVHVDVPPERFAQGMSEAGMPPWVIDMQVRYCAAIHAGEVDLVTDEVANLTGRPPRSFASWAADHVAAFK